MEAGRNTGNLKSDCRDQSDVYKNRMGLELNRIYHGNCMDIMQEIEDNSIALTVTSPPYNMAAGKYQHAGATQKQYKVYRDDMTEGWYKKFLYEFIRLALKKSRYLALNIQYITDTKEPIIYMLMEFKNNLKDVFIWKKGALPGTLDESGNARLSTGFEFVFLFGEDGTRSFKHHNFPVNGYLPNIMEWHRKESFKDHHATFPVELPEFFIQNFTLPFDVVLDPFMGTGTTAVACEKLDRKYIGIDISEPFCELARYRVASVRNTKLTKWFDKDLICDTYPQSDLR